MGEGRVADVAVFPVCLRAVFLLGGVWSGSGSLTSGGEERAEDCEP